MNETTKHSLKKDLVITRVFNAPVELAWKAWSDSEHVKQWWGPNGFSCPMAKIDFRVGGTSLVCMRFPKEFGGQDVYNTWTYEEIALLKRFTYILRFSDKEGHVMDPSKLGLPSDMPKEMRNEVVFRKLGKSMTEITVTEYNWPIGEMMERSKMGMEQCLDKMALIFARSERLHAKQKSL